MHIFVDESGSFVVPKTGGHRVVGVVGIVVPTGQGAALFRRFRRLKRGWPGGPSGAEIKGSRLSERQVAATIDLLASFDVVAEAVLTDMGVYAGPELQEFHLQQADKLIEHITPEYAPEVVAEVNRMREQCLAIPPQLFVQAFLTITLLSELLQTATMYHAFRLPLELGRFDWVVDAKDRKITTMEKLWSTMMLPSLETAGFTKPFIHAREGDYRAFRRFEIRESELPPTDRRHVEWVKSKTPKAAGTDYTGIDLGKIFRESFRFANSEDEPGLQLADIIASALCRAFNGNLKVGGWGEIGSLFVCRSPELGGSIHMLKLDPKSTEGGELLHVPYRSVRARIEARCKSMFSSRS